MKLERLMYILITLLTSKKIIAKDVAEKFHVSIRTIYRDIDTLTLSGIPIYSERGNNGGFFLAENYKMSASLFSEEEQDIIFNISRNINQMINYVGTDILEKKMDSYKSDNLLKSNYYFDFNSWNIDKNNLDKIDSAIKQTRLLKFRYTSKKETTCRCVIPYNLIFKMNAWYLLGFCLEKEDKRFFKLTRIRNLEIHTQSFDKSLHSNLTYQQLEHMVNPLISIKKETIQLQFSLNVMSKVYDNFKETEIEICKNHILVKADRTINDDLIDFLLGFGYNVKIISPTSLYKKIVSSLKKNLKQYDNM